jgi:hypothetical protein
MIGWVIALIVIGIIALIGGTVLPGLVPFITSYTAANADTISTGTPFMQLMVQWWPVLLGSLFFIAVVVVIRMKSGGGSV